MALAEVTLADRPDSGVPGRLDTVTPRMPARRTLGPVPATCRDGACTAAASVLCGYVDGHGRACGTRWCSRHSQKVGEEWYCRRHANTILALGGKGANPRTLPPVDHRGAALVSWVFTEGYPILNHAVVSSLKPGEVVFEDHSVNVSQGRDGARRWERGWRIGDREGVVGKVTLRVEESDDALVSLVSGDRVVAVGIPPWIARRRENQEATPAEDAEDRRHFYAFLEGFVRQAVSGLRPREERS